MDDMHTELDAARAAIASAEAGDTDRLHIEIDDLEPEQFAELYDRIVQVRHLTSLALGNVDVSAGGAHIDARLYDLSELRSLDLCTDLEQLPAGISRLAKLEVLRLPGYAGEPYPHEIFALHQLRELGIAIPQEHDGMPIEEEKSDLNITRLENLEVLDLDDAVLYCLPAGIVKLRNLRRLSLRGPGMTEAMPDGLADLPSLREVDVRGSGNAALIPAGLRARTDVTILE